MRVLYLAPPSESAQGALAYGFQQEEALALKAAGHELYLIGVSGFDREVDGLHVRVLPPGRQWRERTGTPRFLLRLCAVYRQRMGLRAWARSFTSPASSDSRRGSSPARELALIHSHFAWPAGIGGAVAAADTGRPLIASFRGMDLDAHEGLAYGMRRDAFMERAIRNLVRRADRTTYVSDYLRWIGLSLGADPAATRTILKGVDLERFCPASDRPDSRRKLGFTGPLLLSVGGLQKLKGIHHVLEALSTLKATHSFSYVVVGEGEEELEQKSQAQRLGLGQQVSFPRAPRPRPHPAVSRRMRHARSGLAHGGLGQRRARGDGLGAARRGHGRARAGSEWSRASATRG